MSQYLIIFLIVAVFRGVVWVVQRVQKNTKAREALMAQQASASMGNMGVGGSPESAAPQASTGPGAPPVRRVASAPARTQGAAARGQPTRAKRGSAPGSRGGTAARGTGRIAGTPTNAASASPGWAASASTRPDATVRQAQGRPKASGAAPSSRAEAREARVGQSSRDVRKLLLDRASLRQALLANEILGPPRSFTT